jgi:hypothetical protein
MNERKQSNHGNEWPESARVHHGHYRYWKRAHHDWRFWIGMFLMLAAITIYVMSDDLALLPRGQPQQPPSGTAGK